MASAAGRATDFSPVQGPTEEHSSTQAEPAPRLGVIPYPDGFLAAAPNARVGTTLLVTSAFEVIAAIIFVVFGDRFQRTFLKNAHLWASSRFLCPLQGTTSAASNEDD